MIPLICPQHRYNIVVIHFRHLKSCLTSCPYLEFELLRCILFLSPGLQKILRLTTKSFLLSQGIGNQKGYEQFDKILMGLLRRILDSNKRVQEAACSAFATLEEVLSINMLSCSHR